MSMRVWSVAVWVALFGLYLVLAGEISTVEGVAGIVCATAGTALAIGLVRVAHRHYRFAPPLHAVIHPFSTLLPETFAVGVDLIRVALDGARGHRGAFVRQSFEPGGDDPLSAGRRATVVLGLSLAPRSFVVRGERADTMILHALPPKAAAQDARWPT